MKTIKEHDVVVLLPQGGGGRIFLINEFKEEFLDLKDTGFDLLLFSPFARERKFGPGNITSVKNINYRKYKAVVLKVFTKWLMVRWETGAYGIIPTAYSEKLLSAKSVLEEESTNSQIEIKTFDPNDFL
jgi:hypothetical protein